MYRIVVVDDDLMTRIQMKTNYDLEKYGYDIVGEAANGAAGLEAAVRLNPDIVITDMSMPNMDGVALIEHLCAVCPDVMIIVISGYDDFDYVSKSLKMKVVDYILKHTLNRETLLDALKRCVDAIGNKREIETQTRKTEEQAVLGRQLQQKNFLLDLLAGKIASIDEIKGKLEELALNIQTSNVKFVIMELDNMTLIEQRYSNIEIGSLTKTIAGILREAIGQIMPDHAGHIEHIYKGRFIILLSYENVYSRLYVMDSVSKMIEALRANLKRYFNFTACYVVGEMCESILRLPAQYEKALETAAQKFYMGNDCVIMSEFLKCKKEVFLTLDIQDQHEIIHAIQNNDAIRCLEVIGQVFYDMTEQFASRASCQIISVELIHLLKNHAKGLPEAFFSFDPESGGAGETIKTSLLESGTVQEIKAFLDKLYTDALTLLKDSAQTQSYRQYTLETIAYIRKNYMKNISLSYVAERISVNKSYLSRVFSEDCGIGFTEYLNRFRVEKAKLLILTGGAKMKSVSEQVGFNNNTYFFKVFKEITGVTPQEYEKTDNM